MVYGSAITPVLYTAGVALIKSLSLKGFITPPATPLNGGLNLAELSLHAYPPWSSMLCIEDWFMAKPLTKPGL